MLFYRAALPLSRKTLTYVSGIIRRHRASIGSHWRKLSPGQQALLVLAYLRKGEAFAELAAGFGVGTTTAWRYVNETVDLLAARAPKLRGAIRGAQRAGHAYVILDGTLVPIDRVAADRPFYSGKHKRHGMNLQVIASPHGDLLWVSGALPGSVHDKRAEWGRGKPESQKEANRAHARLRGPGERANAQLKNWRVLRKLRCCPWRAGKLAKALHALQIREAASG
jgi:Helix-turn-helix of DDE superfamily endonuclease/DDE superfamily endonuclease